MNANATERFVMRFYQNIEVHEPFLLCKEKIVDHLGIKLIYWKNTSSIAKYQGNYYLFLNEMLTEQQQWQEFGHEMYHYFYDETNYDLLHENYAEYGETKADYFAYHFCVPTFMLYNLKGVDVYDVMELFNVEFDFALKRLEMYRNKVLGRNMSYARTYF